MNVETLIQVEKSDLSLSAKSRGLPVVAEGIEVVINSGVKNLLEIGARKTVADLPILQLDWSLTREGWRSSKEHVFSIEIIDERERQIRQEEEEWLLNDREAITIRWIELSDEQRQVIEDIGEKIKGVMQIRCFREADWVGNEYWQDLTFLVFENSVEGDLDRSEVIDRLGNLGVMEEGFVVLKKKEMKLIDEALEAEGVNFNNQKGVVESYKGLKEKRKDNRYEQKVKMVNGEWELFSIDQNNEMMWGGLNVNQVGLLSFEETVSKIRQKINNGGGMIKELITFSGGAMSKATSPDEMEQILQVTEVDGEGNIRTGFKIVPKGERFDPVNYESDPRFKEMAQDLLNNLNEKVKVDLVEDYQIDWAYLPQILQGAEIDWSLPRLNERVRLKSVKEGFWWQEEVVQHWQDKLEDGLVFVEQKEVKGIDVKVMDIELEVNEIESNERGLDIEESDEIDWSNDFFDDDQDPDELPDGGGGGLELVRVEVKENNLVNEMRQGHDFVSEVNQELEVNNSQIRVLDEIEELSQMEVGMEEEVEIQKKREVMETIETMGNSVEGEIEGKQSKTESPIWEISEILVEPWFDDANIPIYEFEMSFNIVIPTLEVVAKEEKIDWAWAAGLVLLVISDTFSQQERVRISVVNGEAMVNRGSGW